MSNTNILYKQPDNMSKSTNSFLKSAPVELTTVAGYKDFVKRYSHTAFTTVLKEDQTEGYVIKDGDVIATVLGDALKHLIKESHC
ncbi:similar to Saccharomyces cerevisiae YBR085C-A Putative protein of unknown function [Maudiozyma saulgeensis]|uniref:Uncharacterized protein n=1 Tax=Maudiozyma saulgeensis TaxID=1789683 RepID=A0A1X7R849_9SACH|nr:similar to Saccharomyces cerevisiae YBR085C-A Putative protein of unknown function [Kazachstania saulgeensis]